MAASLQLTDTARVKARLNETTSVHDALIAQLIAEASEWIETAILGRYTKEQSRTEYYDGSGTDTLLLRQGPLVSVTTVHSVAYSDNAGAQVETLTEITAANRVPCGLRTDGHLGLGWIRLLCGVFHRGPRNYKVVYTAGLSTNDANVPDSLKRAATEAVVAAFNRRDSSGLISRASGDSDRTFVLEANLVAAIERSVLPYRAAGFG